MHDETIVEKGKKWEFDDNVTAVFDDMLKRSIPEHDTMRKIVAGVGSRYVKPDTYILDVGCSNGNATESFVESFSESNKFIMLDVSEPMLKKCKEKYSEYINNGTVNVMNWDISEGLPNVRCSLVLSVLTVQFTPIEKRQKIIKSIYNVLDKGGALIFVEKVLGNSYEIDDMLVSEYYNMKSENQYTQAQIESKRKSLEGVLVPITAKWNEELLKETGFDKVDCIWRYLNFAAWVAVK